MRKYLSGRLLPLLTLALLVTNPGFCVAQEFPDWNQGIIVGRDLRPDEHLFFSEISIDWLGKEASGELACATTDFGPEAVAAADLTDFNGVQTWPVVFMPASSVGFKGLSSISMDGPVTNFFASLMDSKYLTFDDLEGSWNSPHFAAVSGKVIDGFRIDGVPWVRAEMELGAAVFEHVGTDFDGTLDIRFPKMEIQLYNFQTHQYEQVGIKQLKLDFTFIVAHQGSAAHIGDIESGPGETQPGTAYRIVRHMPVVDIRPPGDPARGPWDTTWHWEQTVVNEGYYTYPD